MRKIRFTKMAIFENDEHLHCTLCDHGRKAGVVLWRVEFTGPGYAFHWLLCNQCRYEMFLAFGGKRIEELRDDNISVINAVNIVRRLLKRPKQKVSHKGEVRTSWFYKLSPDRRAAIEAGYDLKEYERSPENFKWKNDKIVRVRRKKKRRSRNHDDE